MCLEDDGCGVVRAIGVRRTDSSTLSVFEAMAPGHASVLLKTSTGEASTVVATILLTVAGPPVDTTAAATHLVWMKQSDEDRSRHSGSTLGEMHEPTKDVSRFQMIQWNILPITPNSLPS